MDFLNNVNVIIGIVVGIFGVGGYIFGIVAYFRHKVASSQQTIQHQPSQRNFPQAAPKSLSKLDWMEVLWTGLEDAIRSRGGSGVFGAIMVLMFGGAPALFISTDAPHVAIVYIAVFGVIYFTFLLLFYVYFVGRRIEKKVEKNNQSLTKKSKSIQSY